MIRAHCSADSALTLTGRPLVGVKNAGNSSVLYPTIATPCVSYRDEHLRSLTKYSRVRGRSKIDLAPAQTTAIGVRPNSFKSALMSMAAESVEGRDHALFSSSVNTTNTTSHKHSNSSTSC